MEPWASFESGTLNGCCCPCLVQDPGDRKRWMFGAVIVGSTFPFFGVISIVPSSLKNGGLRTTRREPVLALAGVTTAVLWFACFKRRRLGLLLSIDFFLKRHHCYLSLKVAAAVAVLKRLGSVDFAAGWPVVQRVWI